MKILIGADLVPTDSNRNIFSKGDAEKLVGKELCEILKSVDYRIFNLEVPLTDLSTPIEKCGPSLIAPTSTIVGYKALGADCVTIANNHIMDQGEQGFTSTRKVLEEHGISYVGGGDNLAEAAKPYILELEGKRIGIYACAEHEFSIAEEQVPGANPFDPLESPDHVAALKAKTDYVIVLYHGGKEHYRYPSPNLQKTCRKLVAKGADLVICQHSHCIGCEEKYGNGTIVYGQGNFLFDHSKSEFWQTSLLIQIGDKFEISYIPLEKKGNVVRLAKDPDILEQFSHRSMEICMDGFVSRKYAEFAESMLFSYLWRIYGRRSLLYRALNKLSRQRLNRYYIRRKLGRKRLLSVRNAIECEAHQELFLCSLKNLESE